MSYNVIKRLREHWGWDVTKVKDAPKDLSLEVTRKACRQAVKRNPEACAIAQAAISGGWDKALIGRGISYLLKGKTAHRFITGAGARHEVGHFDDPKGEFFPGTYTLYGIRKAQKLGTPRPNPESTPKTKRGPRRAKSISSRPQRERV